jgi:hypothetical protein
MNNQGLFTETDQFFLLFCFKWVSCNVCGLFFMLELDISGRGFFILEMGQSELGRRLRQSGVGKGYYKDRKMWMEQQR